ncbi:MAG: type II pantothenate kinase [Bacteroidetes bacterium]|nr:MAG: type II pantothenate kinase [Bacteroidota bacterium]
MIIGIDIGGSTTKIVGFQDNKLLEPLSVEASDPVASASGALGKFINTYGLSINQVKLIRMTGVGASFIHKDILGIPVYKVEEFRALGHGGLYLSGLKRAVIVSMGTGTALVKAHGNCISHIGGTGVGGGTIMGLSKAMLNLTDFDNIISLAESGDLSQVDLSISDISMGDIGNLPPTLTASNFGKMSDKATKNDLLKAVLNMVFQTIGMMAVLAAKVEKDTEIVISGNLITIPQAMRTFNELSKLYKVKFHLPKYARYCTAIGAAISHSEKELNGK